MTPSMRVAKPILRDDPGRAVVPAWDREADRSAAGSSSTAADPPR
jgi:hypothetical protein